MTPQEMLNQYADLEEKIAQHEKLNNDQRVTLDKSKNVLLSSILTPEQKVQMDEINAEFAPKYAALTSDEPLNADKKDLADLRKKIEDACLEAKVTLKGDRKMVVYTPEKKETVVTVNTDMLRAFTVDIPKLHTCWTEQQEITDAKTAIRKRA